MARTQSPDTDPEVEACLIEAYRRMTFEAKIAHIGELGRMAEQVALAALAAKYPGSTEAENRLRLLSRWLDRATMIRVYAWDPEVKGR